MLVIDLMLVFGWCLFAGCRWIVGFVVNSYICNCVLLFVDLLGLIRGVDLRFYSVVYCDCLRWWLV